MACSVHIIAVQGVGKQKEYEMETEWKTMTDRDSGITRTAHEQISEPENHHEIAVLHMSSGKLGAVQMEPPKRTGFDLRLPRQKKTHYRQRPSTKTYPSCR